MYSAYYKSTIFIIILFIISACSDSNERRGRMTPEEQLAQLTERLDLNAEHSEKVKTILDEQRKKFSKMREDFSGDRSEMRESMMQAREETDEMILEILDDEQKRKYEEMQEERRERMRQFRKQRQ